MEKTDIFKEVREVPWCFSASLRPLLIHISVDRDIWNNSNIFMCSGVLSVRLGFFLLRCFPPPGDANQQTTPRKGREGVCTGTSGLLLHWMWYVTRGNGGDRDGGGGAPAHVLVAGRPVTFGRGSGDRDHALGQSLLPLDSQGTRLGSGTHAFRVSTASLSCGVHTPNPISQLAPLSSSPIRQDHVSV